MDVPPPIDQRGIPSPLAGDACGETALAWVMSYLGQPTTALGVVELLCQMYGARTLQTGTDVSELIAAQHALAPRWSSGWIPASSPNGLRPVLEGLAATDGQVPAAALVNIRDDRSGDPNAGGQLRHWIACRGGDASGAFCMNPWGGRLITYPWPQLLLATIGVLRVTSVPAVNLNQARMLADVASRVALLRAWEPGEREKLAGNILSGDAEGWEQWLQSTGESQLVWAALRSLVEERMASMKAAHGTGAIPIFVKGTSQRVICPEHSDLYCRLCNDSGWVEVFERVG